MSALSAAKKPTRPTSGRPCGAGQLVCEHYMRCGDHCAADRFDCPESPVGWRWFYKVAEWEPVCDAHFYVQGVSGNRHRLLDEDLEGTPHE